MPRLLRPHLVPKSVAFSLPHLYSNFLASSAIDLVNHWNDYENHEGMVYSKPWFYRQVSRLFLSSVVDSCFHCGRAQHRPCGCTLPQTYREEFRVTSKYLPENYAEHIEFVIIF